MVATGALALTLGACGAGDPSAQQTSAGGKKPVKVGVTVYNMSSFITEGKEGIDKYAKENNKLVILGGTMGAQVLDTSAVQALAELPSLDELRATQRCGMPLNRK